MNHDQQFEKRSNFNYLLILQKKKLKWYLQKQDRANDYFFLQQQKCLSKIAHHLHYSLIIFKLLSRHFNGSMIKILKFFFVCAFFLNHRRNDFRVSCQSKSTGTCHLSWHCKDKMSNEFFMLILWNFLFPEYVNILFKNEIFVFDEITQ